MKCIHCGGEMNTAREDVPSDELGLPGVTLLDVEVSRCPACGEVEIAIPMLERLHRSLAVAIITKPGRLSGVEIRFLRKFLGYSGEDFARLIGASPSTVSRWENGKQAMNEQTDRLLRLMVVQGRRVKSYPLDTLAGVAQAQRPQNTRYQARPERDGWHASIAA